MFAQCHLMLSLLAERVTTISLFFLRVHHSFYDVKTGEVGLTRYWLFIISITTYIIFIEIAVVGEGEHMHIYTLNLNPWQR